MQFGATKKLLFQVALLSKYCFFVIFVKADRLTILTKNKVELRFYLLPVLCSTVGYQMAFLKMIA